MNLIKAYFWNGLAVILGLLLAFQTLRLHTVELEKAKAEVAWSEERTAAATKLAAATTKARETEEALGSLAANTRKETNEQIRSLAAQRDALLARLRSVKEGASNNNVSQATPVTSTGGVTPISDGTSVLGTLGEEDVEEALRGDTIRLQLVSCYRQYNEARKALSQ